MIIVIPIGPNDQKDLVLLTKMILHFGHVGDHPILLVSVPSRVTDAETAQRALATVCTNVEVVNTGNEFPNGWHIGPDRMWNWLVTHLDNSGNKSPWLWLECDACPTSVNWANKLAEAYRSSGKAFFGHSQPTKWKNADGSIFTKAGDNTLRGVAIYPANISRDTEIQPLFNNLAYEGANIHPPDPWDIYLRWLFFKRGVASSPLIYDRWKTCNYVRDEVGDILCEPCPGVATAEGGMIPREAVLVHGCKDESLQNLILGVKSVAAPVVAPVGEATIYGETFVPVPPASPDKLGLEDIQYSEPVALTIEQKALLAIESEARPRIGAIVASTGIGKAELLSILPKIGYRMKQAGWLERTETEEV